MRGYKVIIGDKRESYSFKSNVYAIQYPVNVEVFPKLEGSRLYFFKNLADAEAFVYDYCGNYPYKKVVPCIGKNARKVKYVAYAYKDILNFWAKKGKVGDWDKFIVPRGTWGATSIICLE